MKKEKGKKAEHDDDTGVALGEIEDYHGMAPSHHQSLQGFAFGNGASVGSLEVDPLLQVVWVRGLPPHAHGRLHRKRASRHTGLSTKPHWHCEMKTNVQR